MLKKIKENNEWKSVEIDVVTKFKKDKVNSSYNDDNDVDVDTDDDEQNMIIEFR